MKKAFISISSLALVAALSIASFATGVFATDASASTTTDSSSTNMEQRQKPDGMSAEKLKTMLSQLVTDGTITQDEADEAYSLATADDSTKADLSKLTDTVKEALKSSMTQKSQLCSGLTDEQTTKVTTAVKESFETTIASLVSDGTITQDQADKIISNVENMAQGGQGGQGGPGENADAAANTSTAS